MRVLGLISGTSHDGIDSAVVDWSMEDGVLTGVVERTGERPYDHELRARIVAALPPNPIDMAEVCRLDTLIGQAFADAAEAGGPADLICSHGQTLYHWVEGGTVRGTLQLGQPAWIAERTGVPVVSDLRARDVSAGGQGAPLVSFFDLLLLAGLPGRSGALNLGGIANLTVRELGIAYDTGPASALMDAAVSAATGMPYDEDGRLAAAGRVHEELLRDLLAEPYYRALPPKTTGKELFHPGYLARIASPYGPALPDLLATLTALTAETVAAEIRRHRLDTVIVSGGGVRNPVLVGMLRERAGRARIAPSDEFGVPSDAKEAIAFSLFGWMTAHGLPATVPGCTGATGPRVLGAITPGRGPLTLPVPLREAPDRMRLDAASARGARAAVR
ncbi:anhydro-N-acetylmuramic acid kinase [Streptosporangium roseum]|uniref:Anhydro-N-acetylmuramic acid kinase n=1 Tax=Streptosporangium roseum (strain ATCC 12428 / DSM 43021 / JCM 3005 / KCTC 9067 / NCIMB 10171 / NRRL 2505 / NI 9100) TaxID=479432 RepID=D2AR66_STRRD|nr:anhydro-N-acetylmuramic acid kinase [Streptosporangium roseum]ACZ88407.1 anhydro-N-acetylmuramic acid kinase [Streptosporangium roseum DSM 43021]